MFAITYANESQMLRRKLKEYTTKQRQLITNVLKNCDALTADEIFLQLKDEKVSLSTVYRNLDKLVESNFVIRELSIDGKRSLYRINKTALCKGHIHLQCSRCGNVIHISNSDTDKIGDAIKAKYGFSIDEQALPIIGICERCKKLL